MKETEAILWETGVIPVIKLEREEHAVPLAQALLKGGIRAAEITFRTAAAAGAIRRIAQELPELFVCAGTVLSVEQAEQAVRGGAKAVISPGLNPKVVQWCVEQDVPVYPGCATPTEVEAAMGYGLGTVKLFPAEVVGGVSMLKALYGPYREMRFMPTGGITLKNLGDYLSQPNVIACGGSWLCPGKAVEAEDWKTIETLAAEARQAVEQIRP